MSQTNVRYHALDSMRSSMMLLGIYLHVVIGYSGMGFWPYIDTNPTHVLDFTLSFIHAFRMPAFYVMAGFFGAMLWNSRGPAQFASNRVKRILLPFLLFWPLLFPMVKAITSLEKIKAAVATVATAAPVERVGPDRVPPALLDEVLKRLHPWHLWFLEYLLLLYALGAVVAWSSRWFPDGLMERIHAGYRWALQRWYAPALFALFSWLPLAQMNGYLKLCDGFIPEMPILLAYTPPFTFGWLLYHHRDLLGRFQRQIGLYLAVSLPVFLVYKLVPGLTYPFVAAAANVLFCWTFTFACIGLFLKYTSGASAGWRYMSDASYWLFIMHMPVVVAFQVAFRAVPLPTLAKVPIVLALSVIVLVVSYDLMVRSTWMGEFLNGRRYARGLPVEREKALGAAAG